MTLTTDYLDRQGSYGVEASNVVSGGRRNPQPHVFSDRP
jgi:hypothetical protein